MTKYQVQIQTIQFVEIEAESPLHINIQMVRDIATDSLTDEQALLGLDVFSIDKDNCLNDCILEIE